MDAVLYRHGIPHSLHRAGGDHAELHLRLPGQGGGQEHVLQRRQHHQLLRLRFSMLLYLFSRVVHQCGNLNKEPNFCENKNSF